VSIALCPRAHTRPMHSLCISVDSLLSAREYTVPIHSTAPHPRGILLEWRGRAGGRRPRGGAVGVGGCARLRSSAASMRSVSSTRLRCAWTLWAVSGNPSGIPGSTMGLATGTSAGLRAGHDVCRAPGSASRWGRAGRKLADARGHCGLLQGR
jgi:hypothetical protein